MGDLKTPTRRHRRPQGMLSARGRRMLMVDADGATDIRDLVRLEKALDEIAPVRVGLWAVSGPPSLCLFSTSEHLCEGGTQPLLFFVGSCAHACLSESCTSHAPSTLSTAQSDDDYGVVVGSRAHLEDDAVAQRSFFRTVLMYGFHFAVAVLCVRGIRDTQVRLLLPTGLCFQCTARDAWCASAARPSFPPPQCCSLPPPPVWIQTVYPPFGAASL